MSDGRTLYVMLQSAMLDEGGSGGTVHRIDAFDTRTARPVAQYAYRMEASSQGRGISALVAIKSSVQCDVYFKPLGGGLASRIQCDIGAFDNCTVVNADGTAGIAVTWRVAVPSCEAGHRRGTCIRYASTTAGDLAAAARTTTGGLRDR